MHLRLRRLTLADLATAEALQAECFDAGWEPAALEHDLRHNGAARYVILERLAGGQWDAVGYGGLWLMFDEAHIVTVGVRPPLRREGLGRLLVHALVVIARANAMADLTLEVRVSNVAARALYARYGFWEVGERKRYYADNNEDAVIMTTEALDSEAFVARFAALEEALVLRFGHALMEAVTSFDPGAIAPSGGPAGAPAVSGR